MGGVPIFIGFGISVLIWWGLDLIVVYKLLLGALLLVFILGLRDDLIPLKASHKLLSQIIPAIMIAMMSGGMISSFYGLLGGIELPFIVSILLTVFTIAVIINSINLIDGADGLAGSVSLVILTFYTIWFYLNGFTDLTIISVTFLGSLIAFLYFNWKPSKIFMGDTGALMIGLIISFLTIQFLNTNYSLAETSSYKFNAPIATSFCILIIPLFDTLRVFIIRISQKRSPFSPDKNHIHHSLMKKGFNHAQISITLGLINILFILFSIIFRQLPDTIMIPIVLGIGILINIFIGFDWSGFTKNQIKPVKSV